MTSLAALPKSRPALEPSLVQGSASIIQPSVGPALNQDRFSSPVVTRLGQTVELTSALDPVFRPAPALALVPPAAKKAASVKPSSILAALTPERMIAGFVKSTFVGKTDAQMRDMVKEYFGIMKLVNEDGEWADPKLAVLGEQLIPTDLSVEDFKGLVDSMADNAAKNPYIHTFLKAAAKEDFSELFAKVKAEGGELIPGFAAYAMVLQNLTVAMRDDFEVAKACEAIWRKNREAVGSPYANIGFSGAVKYHSVEYPVSRMTAALDKGEIDGNFGSFILPLNILEAMVYDVCKGGNWDNAGVAWITATHRPGGTPNEATGAGDTVLTEDGNGISVNMPLPKEWADLYHAWNMAFVSQFAQFPYSITKLLIPKVADYQDNPSEYIHTRALALYAHLNFILYRGGTTGVGAEGTFDWSTPEMTKLFGKTNLVQAKAYAAEVDRLNPSLSTRMKAAIKDFFIALWLGLQAMFRTIGEATSPFYAAR